MRSLMIGFWCAIGGRAERSSEVNNDTILAAVYSMRAIVREMQSRAASAESQGFAWAASARREADRASAHLDWLEKFAAREGAVRSELCPW